MARNTCEDTAMILPLLDLGDRCIHDPKRNTQSPFPTNMTSMDVLLPWVIVITKEAIIDANGVI